MYRYTHSHIENERIDTFPEKKKKRSTPPRAVAYRFSSKAKVKPNRIVIVVLEQRRATIQNTRSPSSELRHHVPSLFTLTTVAPLVAPAPSGCHPPPRRVLRISIRRTLPCSRRWKTLSTKCPPVPSLSLPLFPPSPLSLSLSLSPSLCLPLPPLSLSLSQ